MNKERERERERECKSKRHSRSIFLEIKIHKNQIFKMISKLLETFTMADPGQAQLALAPPFEEKKTV